MGIEVINDNFIDSIQEIFLFKDIFTDGWITIMKAKLEERKTYVTPNMSMVWNASKQYDVMDCTIPADFPKGGMHFTLSLEFKIKKWLVKNKWEMIDVVKKLMEIILNIPGIEIKTKEWNNKKMWIDFAHQTFDKYWKGSDLKYVYKDPWYDAKAELREGINKYKKLLLEKEKGL